MVEHDVWLIQLGDSFHMTPHKEWFCEYETYNGGDFLQGDNSTTKIIGYGRVNLFLKYGIIRSLHGVQHIPYLDKKPISISNMAMQFAYMVFEKVTCKMVQGEMVLVRVSLLIMGVTIILFLRVAMKKIRPILSMERKQIYGIKDWDILERRAFKHYLVKVWLKVCLIVH